MITYSTTRTELETKTLMTERKHVNLKVKPQASASKTATVLSLL